MSPMIAMHRADSDGAKKKRKKETVMIAMPTVRCECGARGSLTQTFEPKNNTAYCVSGNLFFGKW